jgi:protein-disulfide isomerase
VQLSEPDWARVSLAGHRLGPVNAPVSLVVFSDFQCPFCARFALEALPGLERRFPGKLAVIVRHWPLSNHAWAYRAARAAECATQQDKFREMHDGLFREQRSIGTKSFVAFARDAGIGDLGAFERCVSDDAPVQAIDRDIAEARAVGARGTPTLIVNGLVLQPPYSTAAIADRIEHATHQRARP